MPAVASDRTTKHHPFFWVAASDEACFELCCLWNGQDHKGGRVGQKFLVAAAAVECAGTASF
jgi:hypothetical protein